MINFKEHDGMLFKMLDKPVPLTPDAEMPCLVRFRMPFSERFRRKHEGVAFFCDAIKKNPLCGNRLYAYETRRVGCIAEPRELEIIGTLVKEGSKEWALYQMMQGKWVYNPFLEKHKSDKLDTRCLHAYSKFGQDVVVKNILTGVDSILGAANISHWTSYAEPTGWQLYEEPKPEPIFTIGDKVTDGVIEGTIIHIEDAIADVCPSTDEYKIELRNLNHIPESPKQDDVEKPLRSMIAEAKATGKNIRTYYRDIVFTPQALEECLNQGKFRWWNICNWELTTREQNYFPSISTSSGAPNPESATQTQLPVSDATQYKAGDWVEVEETTTGEIEHHIVERINTFCPVSPEYLVDDVWFNHDGMEIIPLDWTFSRKRITRKLDPSEIVIHIGCLSGTIAKSSDPNYFLMLHSRPITDCNYSMIRFSAIDTETREIVESLLEAQEER